MRKAFLGSNAKLTKPFDGCQKSEASQTLLYMARRTKDSRRAGRLHWRTSIVIKVNLLTSECVHASFTSDRLSGSALPPKSLPSWLG